MWLRICENWGDSEIHQNLGKDKFFYTHIQNAPNLESEEGLNASKIHCKIIRERSDRGTEYKQEKKEERCKHRLQRVLTTLH